MVDLDFIVKNWDYLSKRRVREIPIEHCSRILRMPDTASNGKFFGTPDMFDRLSKYSSIGLNGSRRLFLRPYVIAPMPKDRIKAVFIDPKKYIFNEDGVITGVESCWEPVIYILVDSDCDAE